jgi:hypothetical protein
VSPPRRLVLHGRERTGPLAQRARGPRMAAPSRP